MAARLKFRHRIGLLLVLAGAALVAVTIVTLVLGQRSEGQLTAIQTRYVPLIELERDLKGTSTAITKAFEDAAAAADETKLSEADRLKASFLRRLAAGAQAIRDNGGSPVLLREAFVAYYTDARDVSQALVGGTSATRIAPQIAAMDNARRTFQLRLDAAVTPDHTRLAAAFATARSSQRDALAIDIVVAVAGLSVMALLSWRLIQRTVRSLQAVSDGVERLARGEFGTPIEVPAGDEIGDLAHEANRTADRLREYREEADREAARAKQALLETQRQALAAEAANKELESFSYSVSHDLRAPLRGISGFSQALVEDEAERLSPRGQDYLKRIRAGAQRMGELIDDLLRLSRVSRAELRKERVDLSALVRLVAGELRKAQPEPEVKLVIADDVQAFADARLIRITFENLLGNAWKFSSKVGAPEVEFGTREDPEGTVYFVRDNGAGFDMKYADRLFGAFQRLHTDKDFPGTGVGLATVQRIILRHGGRIWAESEVGRGATFYFTLPPGEPAAPAAGESARFAYSSVST